MPPASNSHIIDSMLSKSTICLLLLFKGILSTCVDHSSEILTLHVVHTLNLSQNHMILWSYHAPQPQFHHWQVTLNPTIDISSLVIDWVVSLVFNVKTSIHTLGFVQCLGCHQPYWWLPLLCQQLFILGCYSEGPFYVLLAFGTRERCTGSLVHEHVLRLIYIKS